MLKKLYIKDKFQLVFSSKIKVPRLSSVGSARAGKFHLGLITTRYVLVLWIFYTWSRLLIQKVKEIWRLVLYRLIIVRKSTQQCCHVDFSCKLSDKNVNKRDFLKIINLYKNANYALPHNLHAIISLKCWMNRILYVWKFVESCSI